MNSLTSNKMIKCRYVAFTIYLAVGGAFRNPLALRYLTMNGTEVNVMLIRTGAKTLWIAEMLIQKYH